MRGVNSPLFTEGALIRDPRAVPNLCKADSGLSAMFGILAAISSHLVARCKILSYTCSCPIALRLWERRTKEQEFWPAHPPLVCFGAGARGPGSLGLVPVVATASFPLINLPKFYLSFTILVSLILVALGVFFVALMGLVPVVATASFPLINPPKFYLSFTILVSLILVKYPDRVGLVNTVP